MTAVSVEHIGYRGGKEMVQAVLLSNTSPQTLPTTGADIEGMNENQVFAPFSLLYVTANVENKVFIANENGIFDPQ